MAEAKKDVAASTKNDPTVTGSVSGPEYPEGTHPARDASEVTHSAENLRYEDMPDEQKPSPTSIAQVQVLTGDEATSS